jgi:hypothetical protein
MSEIIDTTVMPDGTEYRVRLERDETDINEPYDEGQWPIIKVWTQGYTTRVEAVNNAADRFPSKYTGLVLSETSDPEELFARYVRMFHGGTAMFTYGPNQATDSKYIAFDTAVWRETVGIEDTAALALEKPLSEIQAWIEGDVWGAIVERRDKEESADWVQEEDVWGFYGREYAESRAKEWLADTVATHKTVYRYPEAEKLAKVGQGVNAILEFLDYMRDEGLRLDATSTNTVHQFYDINTYKLEQERRLMLKRATESEGTTQQ